MSIPWISTMPYHWDKTRAKNLFHKQSRPVRDEDDVVTCFRDGVVTLRKNRRTTGFTESTQWSGYQGIRKGDLVIHVMDAFAGSIGVSDSDGKSTPVYSVCSSKTDVNNYYYAYLLREMARAGFIQSLYRGIRERSSDFRFDVFAGLFLPVPPRHEQDQIVRYLDWKVSQINKLVNAKSKQINLLNEKKQAVITDCVTNHGAGWSATKFKHLTRSANTGLSITKEYWHDGGDLLLYTAGQKPIKASYDDFPVNWLTTSRDILVARNGAGSIHIPITGSVYTDHVIRFVLADWVDRQYVYYALKVGMKKVVAEANTVSLATLNKSDWERVIIFLPPFDEQQLIIDYLNTQCDRIDKTISVINTELTLLTEYRTRLISDVVTGKLDVQSVVVPSYENTVSLSTKELGLDEIDSIQMIGEQEIDIPPITLITKVVDDSKTSKRTVIFKRLVLSAHILDNICDEPTAGRVKFEKLLHLSEYCAEIPLQSDFQRAAAGPYDSRALYSIESQLMKNKWFMYQKNKGDRRAYSRLDKVDGYKQYLDSNFDAEQQAVIDKLIRLFKSAKTIQCEIVSTLYGAWNDFLLEDKKPTDDEIVTEVLTNWHEKKERIDRERWLSALKWMRKNDIVPVGYGASTKSKICKS